MQTTMKNRFFAAIRVIAVIVATLTGVGLAGFVGQHGALIAQRQAQPSGNINALATQTIAFQWGSYTLMGTGTGARIIATT